MERVTFYNKRMLCYTEVADFTDYQGIGSDPMYRRYDSVYSVVKNNIDEKYQSLLAASYYDYEEGVIRWYVDEWTDTPVCFTELKDSEKEKYAQIKEETLLHYKQKIEQLNAEEFAILSGALKHINDEFIYCYDNKITVVAWGMRPDTSKHLVSGSWIKGLKIEEKFTITFDAGSYGKLTQPIGKVINRKKGYKLTSKDIPDIDADEGFLFAGWSPEVLGLEVVEDCVITALYDEVQGSSISQPIESDVIFIDEDEPDSDEYEPEDNKIFTPQHEEKVPWYKRAWLWLTGSGCLKWILWAILFVLLLLLLSHLFRGCGGSDHSDRDRFGDRVLDDDTFAPIERIYGDDGLERDNNGTIGSIIDEEGNLPGRGVVAPIIGEGGEAPVVINNEDAPDVIGNRLNIFFENEDSDLNQWAIDFKSVYPSEDYQIIGYDENVRLIQIQIPESQRNRVREEINAKIPNHEFFVFDESIMILNGTISENQNSSNNGWHLRATNVRSAWGITKGTPEVVVAIVDDGIDFKHKMLEGRFYKAYNVFTQNRTLGLGEGHGTHVAGLAVGSEEFYEQGAAGVAPKCRIMPIQVFDNGISTFSSIASGIMYAIHNGADVVNVSIGPSFVGMDLLPISAQQIIAENLFKNEERVFRHIIKTANSKNVILVFAAGNDNIMAAVLPGLRDAEKSVNVAAVTLDFTASDFTNYSIGTNISAPGVNIYSSYPNNSFEVSDGTSMAAPIVSGAIALMRSIKPDLTVEQAIGVLQITGREIKEFVPPMLLIDKALEAVKEGSIFGSPIFSDTNETSPVEDNLSDDYNLLDNMLEQLRAQRDAIDKKIKELEQKMQ